MVNESKLISLIKNLAGKKSVVVRIVETNVMAATALITITPRTTQLIRSAGSDKVSLSVPPLCYLIFKHLHEVICCWGGAE